MTNLYLNNRMKYTVLIKTLILLFLFSSPPVLANIGKIVYGYGDNHAFDSDGNRRKLSKGSVVNEGDTLVTGRGRMHVRLIDGGFISVYPNTEYKVDVFKYSGKKYNDKTKKTTGRKEPQTTESKADRGFFSLLKGAARQVTGYLGRTYNENFKLRTSVATIGIRGTGFFAKLCQADCFDAEGKPMQDGMYVKNNTGVITMTTKAGDVSLAQGQSAFAASNEDSPQQIIQPPVAYNIVTPNIELYDFDQQVVDTRGDLGEDGLPGIPNIDPPLIPPAPTIVLSNLEYTTITSLSAFEPLNGLDVTSPTDSLEQNGNTIEHFETEVFIPIVGNVPVIFDKGTATLAADSGSEATLGVVWNRWNGSYLHTLNGVAVNSLDNNIHLIASNALTQSLPTSGLVNYTGTGGTNPTFTGATGNMVGTQTVSATIDYIGNEVLTLDIATTFPDATSVNAYLAGTSGNTFIVSGGNVYIMNGDCMGVGCGGNGAVLSGAASVNMVGPNAEGIYGIYNLTSGTGENAVSGSYLATDGSIQEVIVQQ